MKELEIEGKTVTHAVEKGLAELGLRRDQVEVHVLQEAAPGFLGLGAKLARVRISEKMWGTSDAQTNAKTPRAPAPRQSRHAPNEPRRDSPRPAEPPRQHAPSHAPAREHHPAPPKERAPGSSPSRASRPSRPAPAPSSARPTTPVIQGPPPDPEKACAQAKEILDELLPMLRIEHPNVLVSWDDKQVRVCAEVETPDTQVLIGKGGQAIEALQFLVTLMISRRMKTPVAAQVECAGYWREKEESILLQVHQAMEMVNRTQRPVRLKPMDACMRRLVHRTLANHAGFETASEGEGSWRKVVIKPKKK